MGEFSDATFDAIQRFVIKRTVQGQGGLLSGEDPATYYPSDPLRLWIIQMSIIVMMAQLLGLILGKIKQPRVIAEVIGGILLGPTAFGRIPGFTNHIFPSASLPFLSLTANIGLCLFLFIIGLEIDPSVIRRNARLSVVVSLSGVLIPFGVGCGISVALYHQFIDPSINFKYFMLFVGVSFSITAFPVLCRILTALKLLDSTVGLIVLSAGVANDVIGWTLLALAVALVNASSGLTALWTFLTCLAYTLVLIFPVKWGLLWLARKTGSTTRGLTMPYMTVVMLLLWGSSFFTDIVGVNAIFGAFIVGTIVPREGGVAIMFVEKLEDLVSIIFLPLYFTISGLNTNLGLINTGTAWGFVFAIASLDFTGKFTGCTLSSRALGFKWREAATVGSLMTCKGLVELIVLNIGLSAGILSQEVFSMFVFEALLLTFMTTPLVNLLYPPHLRTLVHRPGAEGITEKGDKGEADTQSKDSQVGEEQFWRNRFSVVLDEFHNMPGIMALTKLVLPHLEDSSVGKSSQKTSAHALRLVELSERTSSLIKSSMTDTLISTDPLVSVFKMFAEQSDLSVSASLSVVSRDEWARTVTSHAKRSGSQLLLLPWIPYPAVDHNEPSSLSPHNTFDAFFRVSGDNCTLTLDSQFIRSVFRESETDVALFVGLGDNTGTNGPQHILCPFFGGPDDRLALEFVVQLCTNPRMSATVVRIREWTEKDSLERPESALSDLKDINYGTTLSSSNVFPDTVYGKPTAALVLQSDAADDLTWSRFSSPTFENDTHDSLRSALSRIEFTELASPVPLHDLTQLTKDLHETHRRLLVVAGRSKRLSKANVGPELKQIMDERARQGYDVVRNTIGDVATLFVIAGSQNATVVLQAHSSNESVLEV